MRAVVLPQGCITSPAAFNERMSLAENGQFPGMQRLMDDTCLSNKNLKDHYMMAGRYLTQIGKAGISFSPKKFQFAQKEIEYVGFVISPRGLFVSPKILKSLRDFPRPTSQKAMVLNSFFC